MADIAQTLESVIKILDDLPQDMHGTARMVAMLRAFGLNDTQRLADLVGVSRSMVQKSLRKVEQVPPASGTHSSQVEPIPPTSGTGSVLVERVPPSGTGSSPRVHARAHFVSKPSCEEGRKKEIVVDDARALAVKLLEAGGQALSPIAVSLHIMSEPIGWIESGADVDLDIVPTIRALAAKAKPTSIQSWRYFGQAVAKSRDARLEGLPPPQSGARCNSPTVREQKPSEWQAALARLRAREEAARASA